MESVHGCVQGHVGNEHGLGRVRKPSLASVRQVAEFSGTGKSLLVELLNG